MTLTVLPACAGVSLPATSIVFGVATSAGQVSIVRVVTVSRSIAGTGVGAGTGILGTLRGVWNDSGWSVSESDRTLPFRALRKRAAALVRSRWSCFANFEESSLRTGPAAWRAAPTPARAALITFLRSRFS